MRKSSSSSGSRGGGTALLLVLGLATLCSAAVQVTRIRRRSAELHIVADVGDGGGVPRLLLSTARDASHAAPLAALSPAVPSLTDPAPLPRVLTAGAGSIWPAEKPDPASVYTNPFRRRRTVVNLTTPAPPKVINNTVVKIVNVTQPPKIVRVEVPVYINVTSPPRTVTVTVTVTVTAKPVYRTVPGQPVYVPVPGPGQPVYVPVPGQPQPVYYTVPAQPQYYPVQTPAQPYAQPYPVSVPVPGTGCPLCAGGGAVKTVGWPPAGTPCPTAPPQKPCPAATNEEVAKLAAAASDLAHANMEAALSKTGAAVPPSSEALDAQELAREATAQAGSAEDAALRVEAREEGLRQTMTRFRQKLYEAASARAAELDRVRIVPPKFPNSLIFGLGAGVLPGMQAQALPPSGLSGIERGLPLPVAGVRPGVVLPAGSGPLMPRVGFQPGVLKPPVK